MKLRAALLLLPLAACTQSGGGSRILHTGETITTPTTWSGDHELSGYLYVQSTLTIDACSNIFVGQDVNIEVQDGGAIVAVGRADCPITFDSAKLSPSPGDWGAINVYSSASASSAFDHVIFKNGGGAGNYGLVWLQEGGTLSKLDNSTFDGVRGDAVQLEDNITIGSFVSNTFSHVSGDLVSVYAAAVDNLSAVIVADQTDPRISLRGTSTEAATWKDLGVPYFVDSPLYVKGGTVTLAAGSEFRLGADVSFEVTEQGGLIADGTATDPVILTSAKASPAAGDWRGLWIYSDANNDNALRHTEVRFGGGGEYGAIWLQEGATFSMTDSLVASSASDGLRAEPGAIIGTFTGNSFDAIGDFAIQAGANNVAAISPITVTNTAAATVRIIGTLTDAATWEDLGVPMTIQSGTYIQAPLTIEAGADFLMEPDAAFEVSTGGQLTINGTETDRVTFSSSKSAPAAGDWRGIWVYADSAGAALHFTTIRHGGSDDYGQFWIQDGASASFENVIFEEARVCDVDEEVAGALTTDTASVFTTCPI